MAPQDLFEGRDMARMLTHWTAADFGLPRAMAGSIVRHVVVARQAPDGTPHPGASPPESEPIGGLPTRVDCELMNLLNVIIGFAGLLAESDRLDARYRRYASHIAASGDRASTMRRAFFKEHRAGPRTGIAPEGASSSPGPASPTRRSDCR
jgi:hypothetical protein